MPRPRRYRLVLFACWAAALVIGAMLPKIIALAVLAIVFAAAIASYVSSADFFAARRAIRQKAWGTALQKLQAWEIKQAGGKKSWLSFLTLGVYSLDSVAIARNNVGVVHLENDKLDWAETSFRSALQQDPLYAVPHVNLAVVAAKRRDAEAMRSELNEAARLGLTSKKTAKKLTALLNA